MWTDTNEELKTILLFVCGSKQPEIECCVLTDNFVLNFKLRMCSQIVGINSQDIKCMTYSTYSVS